MGRANSNRAWILGVGSWVLNCTSGEVRLSGVGESGGVAGVTRRVRVVPPAWDGCPCGGPGMCHGRLWERGLCECEGVGGCGRSDSVVVCVWRCSVRHRSRDRVWLCHFEVRCVRGVLCVTGVCL